MALKRYETRHRMESAISISRLLKFLNPYGKLTEREFTLEELLLHNTIMFFLSCARFRNAMHWIKWSVRNSWVSVLLSHFIISMYRCSLVRNLHRFIIVRFRLNTDLPNVFTRVQFGNLSFVWEHKYSRKNHKETTKKIIKKCFL